MTSRLPESDSAAASAAARRLARERAQDGPAWFLSALDAPRERGFVRVDGVEIEYIRWRDDSVPLAEAQAVALVHGAAANAEWYACTGPLLSRGRDVIAVSFSGCGGSGSRLDEYTMVGFGREVLGVLEALGAFERQRKPMVVTHSMGSVVGMCLAIEHGSRFEGFVLTDVRIDDTPTAVLERGMRKAMEHRAQDRRAEPRAAWKLRPASERQPDVLKFTPPQRPGKSFVMEYVATASSVVWPHGWHWAGDPNRFSKTVLDRDTTVVNFESVRRALQETPIAFVYGERSFFMREASVKAAVYGGLQELCPVTMLPDAGHNVMLDEPLALVTTLRAMLAMWPAYREQWRQRGPRAAL